MKINTQKLLLFLYFSQVKNRKTVYEDIFLLFPDLSAGGVRSFIHLLKAKQLLQSVIINQQTTFQITPYGELMIKKKFPFLEQSLESRDQDVTSEKYHCLILGKPHPQDLHFRQLKKYLTQYHFSNVQRGVYLLKGEISSEFISLCQEKYFSSVLLFAVQEWHIPNIYLFMGNAKNYSDVLSLLSGISREVGDVIRKKDSTSLRKHQSKIDLHSVFTQVFHLLKENLTFFYTHQQLRKEFFSLVDELFFQEIGE